MGGHSQIFRAKEEDLPLERHLEIHGIREDDECLATGMSIDRNTASDDDV
jgi:hypothetical protein